MINRKTALALAEEITEIFSDYEHTTSFGGGTRTNYFVKADKLYDFLYINNYEAWFCNLARASRDSGNSFSYATRKLKDFILKLHTGESIASATLEWNWTQRATLGQRLLHKLAEDILNSFSNTSNKVTLLLSSLELGGYLYRDSRLLAPESDILDVREEADLLTTLYKDLELNHQEDTFRYLTFSEVHYKDGKWEDSISNSRKFLEAILQEIATSHFLLVNDATISNDISSRPLKVREYFVQNGLLENKEKEALSSVYSLLSETGSHPYLAQNEQARLLRHLALTFAQFVMLRYQGYKATKLE